MCSSPKKRTIASPTTGPIPPMPSISASASLVAAGRRRRRFAQRVERAEVAREQPRIGLADMADAERVDEAVQVDLAARLDRPHQVADADVAL